MPHVTRIPRIDAAGRSELLIVETTAEEDALDDKVSEFALDLLRRVGPAIAVKVASRLMLHAAFAAHRNPMPDALASAFATAVSGASDLLEQVLRLRGYDVVPVDVTIADIRAARTR